MYEAVQLIILSQPANQFDRKNENSQTFKRLQLNC